MAAAPFGGSGGPGWAASASTQAQTAIGSAGGGGDGGGGGTTPPPSAMGGGATPPKFGAGDATGGLLKMIPILGEVTQMASDLAMMPMRVMRERIQNNRQTALYMSQALSGMSFARGTPGTGQTGMFGNLTNMPGGLMGTNADLISMLEVGRQTGATFGFGGAQEGRRTEGYLAGLKEMQRMTPGTSLADLSQQLGGQAGNVASAQMSVVMTSGAFSMVKAGGKQKSASEWAEGILRWLEGQRPGRDRGKPFNYGEMLAQHFPGSNIDAWLTLNGISPDMKEVFWNYAEGKASKMGGTQGAFEIAEPRGNIAYERLRSETEITRGETGLASRMAGQYANRETVNKWFNQMMAGIMNRVIPAVTGPGSPLSIIQMLPDFIEDFLYSMLENSGSIGQIVGGSLFDIGAMIGGAGNIAAGAPGTPFIGNVPGGGIVTGDLGDIGDYATTGGTTTAGLNLDMRKRVDSMMKVNPNLRINSGFRDRSTQQRLNAKGVGRVSSRPSAHTRGEAVDMGPAAQYQWLSQNAGKFGLASGWGKGEPWHVGMGDLIPDIPIVTDVVGGALDIAEGIPGIGGFVGAARSVDDIIEMLGKIFGGFFESMKKVGGLLTGGMFGLKDLLKGGDIGSFLGGNITDFLNTMLGPFGKFGAAGLTEGTPFDTGLGKTLPTDIKVGGAYKDPGLRADLFGGGGGGWLSDLGGAVATGTMPGGAPGSPAGNKAIGQQMAATYGWTGGEWSALHELWTRESSWSHTADNPSSSAYGIPQALPGSKMSSAGADWKTNPRTQIKWGLDYIKGRYGSPSKALKHHDQKNWYAGGAWSTDTEMAHLHQDEMVLPATVAEQVRLSLNSGSSSGVVFHNTFNISGGNSGMGGTTIDMQRTVMTLADHLETEMKRRSARSN